MNYETLDTCLQELCDRIGSDVYARIEIDQKAYAGIFGTDNQAWYHSIQVPKGSDYSHIFWSLAYQSEKRGDVSLEDIIEIYNANTVPQ